MLELYNNIKNYRQLNNLTQEELAKKVGYADKGMVSRVENGKVDLSQSQIIKFAEALNVSPGVLMGLDDTPAASSKDSDEDIRAQRFIEKFDEAIPEIQEAVRNLLKFDL